MRRTILRATSGLTLLAVSLATSAHHSSAMFDQRRTVTLQGVVKEFRWTNPHAFIDVFVTGEDGRQQEQWSVEMNGPELLARAGWQASTLEAGDAVSLVIHPLRDGANGGLFVSGNGPRGALMAAPPASVSTETLSPALATSSCVRVDLTLLEPSSSSETRPVKQGERTLFVRRKAITTIEDISEISVAGDDFDARIHIKYAPGAAARLHEATTGRDGLNLAFVVDDDVWLAFAWRGPYGIGPDGVQLSIQGGLAKAQGLVDTIRGCAATETR